MAVDLCANAFVFHIICLTVSSSCKGKEKEFSAFQFCSVFSLFLDTILEHIDDQ